MIDRLDIRPDDRVLLLSIPEISLVLEIADRLEQGIVVGLGDAEQVCAARRPARDRVNVMFQPAGPDEIPWQDGFFSKVVDLKGAWQRPEETAQEVARVLAPGGVACLAVTDVRLLLAAGLEEVQSVETVRILRKPRPPGSARD